VRGSSGSGSEMEEIGGKGSGFLCGYWMMMTVFGIEYW
jgi:hypothetical protein